MSIIPDRCSPFIRNTTIFVLAPLKHSVMAGCRVLPYLILGGLLDRKPWLLQFLFLPQERAANNAIYPGIRTRGANAILPFCAIRKPTPTHLSPPTRTKLRHTFGQSTTTPKQAQTFFLSPEFISICLSVADTTVWNNVRHTILYNRL